MRRLRRLAACIATLLVGALVPANAADRWRDLPVEITTRAQPIEIVAQAATTEGVVFACFNFTNLETRAVDRFELYVSFHDADGQSVAWKTVDRRGSFAPHMLIVGFSGTGGGTRMTKTGQCVVLNGRAMKFPSAALASASMTLITLRYSTGPSPIF